MNQSNKTMKILGAALLLVGIILLGVFYFNSSAVNQLEDYVPVANDTTPASATSTSAASISTPTSSFAVSPVKPATVKANTGLKVMNVKIECNGASCEPPVISAITEKDFTADGVKISWMTDQPATTAIFFSTSIPFVGKTMTVGGTSLSKSHEVDMGFLEANTTYNYVLKSENSAGFMATSSVRSFTTLGKPRLF